ncbi:MAG: DNA topoisomerase IB [Pyrinomonadaceae bacterium]
MAKAAGEIEQLKPLKSAAEIVAKGARARWWRRRGSKGRGFWYEDAKGKRIAKEEDLARINQLVLPPAWKEVRVSPSPRSRLQAIGIDTKGRVQYRYHDAYAASQQRKKYSKIERFGEFLPALRRATNEHIAQDGITRERVLAVVVRLINELYFRVGSEDSVKHYRTYGVTTLRNKHLEIGRKGRLTFSFIGKHHIHHRRLIVDEELAEILRDIKALRGAKLFQYLGDDGKRHPVTPREVNDYIKTHTSEEFSAKDFRTWGGTLLAATELAEIGAPADEKQAKANMVQAVKRVAERLGNTPTVCRSCYIHPTVEKFYTEGVTLEEFRRRNARHIRRLQPEYEPEETALLKMFRSANGNGNSQRDL